jgi:hypothetical protein
MLVRRFRTVRSKVNIHYQDLFFLQSLVTDKNAKV